MFGYVLLRKNTSKYFAAKQETVIQIPVSFSEDNSMITVSEPVYQKT